MYRGTTPNLYLELETELDLDSAREIWVTIKSPVSGFTKDKSEIHITPGEEEGVQQLVVSLSQNDTLQLSTGRAKIQVRILMPNGRAYATEIAEVDVDQILRDGVITDED